MSPDPMSRTCQITDGRQESFSLGYLVGKLWKHLRSVMLGLSMSNTKEVYVEGISSSVKAAICNSILEQIFI